MLGFGSDHGLEPTLDSSQKHATSSRTACSERGVEIRRNPASTALETGLVTYLMIFEVVYLWIAGIFGQWRPIVQESNFK